MPSSTDYFGKGTREHKVHTLSDLLLFGLGIRLLYYYFRLIRICRLSLSLRISILAEVFDPGIMIG